MIEDRFGPDQTRLDRTNSVRASVLCWGQISLWSTPGPDRLDQQTACTVNRSSRPTFKSYGFRVCYFDFFLHFSSLANKLSAFLTNFCSSPSSPLRSSAHPLPLSATLLGCFVLTPPPVAPFVLSSTLSCRISVTLSLSGLCGTTSVSLSRPANSPQRRNPHHWPAILCCQFDRTQRRLALWLVLTSHGLTSNKGMKMPFF